jgi:hypothetical protein
MDIEICGSPNVYDINAFSEARQLFYLNIPYLLHLFTKIVFLE